MCSRTESRATAERSRSPSPSPSCQVDPSSPARSLDALEQEITELASHIHAATCRWLLLIAEFDRREGWGTWGCRSCAEWVSWRCGIAPVAAREHVRVAHRLESLPRIREAFAEGRLSYSKVRALCRLEDVEREDDLLSLARHATAAQLERLVRAYRGVVAVEAAAGGDRAFERWVSWHHEDDGSLVLTARLPAEEGAVVVAALDAARDRLWASGATPGARRADPAQAVDEGGSGDSAESFGEAADRDSAESSVEAVPSDSAGSSPSAGERRADALLLVADSFLAGGADGRPRTGGDRYQVVVHVDAESLRRPAGRGERCEIDGGAPIAGETARRLACDASIVPLIEQAGEPLSVGRKTRSIPPALRRALAARDGGCRFPGCGARRFVDAHHIEHWAHGGATELSNLVQLCRHHHRLLHEGGYTVRSRGDGGLTFHRPDGRRIATCPANPPGRTAGVRRRGVVRDACAPVGDQRLDLGMGVDTLLVFAPPGLATPAATGI
jgi:hypothetical protein